MSARSRAARVPDHAAVLPAAAELPTDARAERDIAVLQAVVLGIRQIRGELDVPHSRATPVYLRSDKPGDAEAIGAFAHFRKVATNWANVGRDCGRRWAFGSGVPADEIDNVRPRHSGCFFTRLPNYQLRFKTEPHTSVGGGHP